MHGGRSGREAGGLLGQPQPPHDPHSRPVPCQHLTPHPGPGRASLDTPAEGCRAWSHRFPPPPPSPGCCRGRGEDVVPPGRARYRRGSRRSGREPFDGRPRGAGPAPRPSPYGSWRRRSHGDRRRAGPGNATPPLRRDVNTGAGGGAVRFPGGGGGFSGLSPGTGSALGVFPRRFPHAAAASSEPPVVGGCRSPPTPPRRALWGGRARPPPSCAAAGGEGARGAAAGAQPCPAPVWKAGDAGLSSSFHLSSGLGGVWFLTALAGVVLCDALQLPGTLA